MKKSLLLVFVLGICISLFGQNTTYYNFINTSQTGATLQSDLASLITTTHTNQISYSTAYQTIKSADQDATSTNSVILIYNGALDLKSNSHGGGGTGAASWNREHVFAKSLGSPDLGTSGPGSDAHNLRACNASINSSRGNNKFAAGSGSYGSVSGGFYPGDDWRGDVARIIFYMNLRYGSQCDISAVSNLSLLLSWNAADPVSAFEDNRNDVIYSVQGNRNPFIDNPHFATQIWGGTPAEDRFTGASSVANPQSFTVSTTQTSASFAATANANADDVLVAYINGNGAFGTPTGTYSNGATITGGGTVLYSGPANAIPDHTSLTPSTTYTYKIWSYESSTGDYSTGAVQTVTTQSNAVASGTFQGFENSAADTWAYSLSPAAYNASGDIWDVVTSITNISSASEGSNFFGIRDIENSIAGESPGIEHVLTLNPVAVASTVGANITFDYNVYEFDNGDYINYELIANGVSQGIVNLFVGGSNASTNNWETETVQIPDGTTQISLKLIAKQNGGGDYAGWDNISLNTGAVVGVENPTLSATAVSPTAAEVQIVENAAADDVLVAMQTGSGATFGTPTGSYSAGQVIAGGGTVIYSGPASNMPLITDLAYGTAYSVKAFSFDGADYSVGVVDEFVTQVLNSTGNLYYQGFESSAADTWAFTTNPAATYNTGGDVWDSVASLSSISPLVGATMWGMQDLNNTNGGGAFAHQLIFDAVSVAGQTNVKVSFAYNVIEFDAGDDMSYQLFYDGTPQTEVVLIDGQDNGGVSTSDWDTVQVNVPAGVSTIALHINTSQNGASDYAAIDDVMITADQSMGLVWDGAAWFQNQKPNNTTLTQENCIIYPGNPVEIEADATVQNLSILQGAEANVLPTITLEVEGSMSNNGELHLAADASGQAQYVGPSTELTQHYYFNRSGWHHIAVPFSNTSVADWQTLPANAIKFPTAGNTAEDCQQCNLFLYSPTVANSSNQFLGTWIAPSTSSEAMDNSTGWIYYVANQGATASITGTTVDADQLIAGDDANEGWNLIPNPYTTSLDWNAKTDFAAEGFNNAYYINVNDVYSTYINGVGVNGATGIIASGQSFFVQSSSPIAWPSASNSSRSFTVLSAMRSTQNQARLKTNGAQLANLITFTAGEKKDEVAFLVDSRFSTDFVLSEDAKKFPSSEFSASLISADGQKLAISALKVEKETQAIPVIFTGNTEPVSVQLSDQNFAGYVYFVDENHHVKELQVGEKLPTSSQKIGTILLSQTPLAVENNSAAYCYPSENGLRIKSVKQLSHIAVFNALGQLVAAADAANAFEVELATAETQQMYVVHVQFKDGSTQVLKTVK